MAVLGADPDQLRDLAKQMRVSGVVISEAAKRIGGQLRTSDWKGTDARDFGARWRSSEAQLVSSGQLLRGAADDSRGFQLLPVARRRRRTRPQRPRTG